MNQQVRLIFCTLALASLLLVPRPGDATIVEVQTNMGTFQVNLYDNDVPETVANFLGYVNNVDYAGSVIHRSVANFVIQGGGFFFDQGSGNLLSITENAPVVNEPIFSNVRGTISMARPPTGVDTATSQWFINLTDNSATLDGQFFAVFGEVVGNGMDVVDSIAALPTFPFASPFGELPLANYTNADFTNNVPVDETKLVIVNAVVVTDATVDTAGRDGLNPPLNPNDNTQPPPVPPTPPPASSGGGGSIGPLLLTGLLVLRRRRRTGMTG